MGVGAVCAALEVTGGEGVERREGGDVASIAVTSVSGVTTDGMELVESLFWLMAVCLLYSCFLEHNTLQS